MASGLAPERSSPVLTRRGGPSGEHRLAAAPLPPRVPSARARSTLLESCEGPAPPGLVVEGNPSHAYTLIFFFPTARGPSIVLAEPGREGESFPPENSIPGLSSSFHSMPKFLRVPQAGSGAEFSGLDEEGRS